MVRGFAIPALRLVALRPLVVPVPHEEVRAGDAGLQGHVYYIPLGCMIRCDADSIAAAGRCVDADVQGLSVIRVMGPRLRDNLDRRV